MSIDRAAGTVRAVTGLGLVTLALAMPGGILAEGAIDQTQQTSSYKLVLHIGPPETMLMPDQTASAKQGEVMVQMPGMPMPSMSMTDQGQPVNHHLEAHIYDKTSGAVLDSVMPAITITNQASGDAHKLDPVMAMYGLQEGKSDFHYGGNVYLPGGTYTVAVTVNGQTAAFKDLAISGVVAPAAMNMPGMSSSMPAALPKTGAGGGARGVSAWAWLAGAAVGLAALGLVSIRRITARRSHTARPKQTVPTPELKE